MIFRERQFYFFLYCQEIKYGYIRCVDKHCVYLEILVPKQTMKSGSGKWVFFKKEFEELILKEFFLNENV